jgi:hypothetical protein
MGYNPIFDFAKRKSAGSSQVEPNASGSHSAHSRKGTAFIGVMVYPIERYSVWGKHPMEQFVCIK